MTRLYLTVVLAAALVSITALQLGTRAQQPSLQPAPQNAQAVKRGGDPPIAPEESSRAQGSKEHSGAPKERQLRKSGGFSVARRPRDANAPPWQPGPIPESISVRVAGSARDEAGRS